MIGRSVFSRTVPLILFVGAVLLLGLVLMSLRFAYEARENSHQALEASRLNARALLLYNLVQDAEASQRGYLMAGEEKYLSPFRRAEALIKLQFLSITGDMIKVGISGTTINRLKSLIDTKINEMKSTIALKTAGRDAEALAIVQTDAGKLMMEEIHQIMTRIDAITGNVGFQRRQALTSGTEWLMITISGGAVLLVALVGGAVWVIYNHTVQLEEARKALAEQNETLEVRIGQRTRHLERANRELQSYAYIVGHDLRAPLVNIMGFTSELERASAIFADYVKQPAGERSALIEKQACEAVNVDIPEALGFIRASMKRMDDLINEILRLARAGSRQLVAERISLGELLSEAIANLQHQLDETDARVEVASDLPHISSDRLALQQIFGNLLDNAVKYGHPTRTPVIRVTGAIAGDQLVIEVSDNGRGIAERDLERIFELFRRSGPQDRPGEGIGLAHVRALVRRLGGDVLVKSVLGEGTTFVVSLAADLRFVKDRGEQ